MKKYILIPIILLFATGCVAIKEDARDDIIGEVLNNKTTIYNKNSKGYKYYLPRNLESVGIDEYNEIIRSDNLKYYLYVDLVSYYNKKELVFNDKNNEYYYKTIVENEENVGLITIDKEDDTYLIKIKYKYVSIQAKCLKNDIDKVITNGLVIVHSVKYNDDVVKKMLSSGVLDGTAEQIIIFEHDDNKETLGYEDVYVDEFENYDPDKIN